MLFSDKGFEEGRWAGTLAEFLRKQFIIPDFGPKGILWRATWKQWIQFEEKDFVGPAFWIGKPAVISDDQQLFSGYYIERGLPKEFAKSPLDIIDPKWHWHGLIKCLSVLGLRSTLNEKLLDLPEENRCIWIQIDGSYSTRLSYHGESTLTELQNIINEAPKDKWINVVFGISTSKAECLKQQDAIALNLRNSLIRAYEISVIVKDSVPIKSSKG